MATCKDCRHWRPDKVPLFSKFPTPGVAPVPYYPEYPEEGMGLCAAIGFGKYLLDVPKERQAMMTVDDPYCTSDLQTGPDFGCVNFQERDSGEDEPPKE